MNTETILYVNQLKTMLACDQGNAIPKKWAYLWLKEIEYQTELTLKSKETMSRLNCLAAVKSN
mgnify:CR=1 FL=1